MSGQAAQLPTFAADRPKAKAQVRETPNALPGSQLGKDRVIPAEHATSDMSPNDALFDAVNRGDIAAAREAIARGADFNARNEIGLTPLDESVDLGRSNITFLLLSLRGGPNDSAPPPPVANQGKPAPVASTKATTTAQAPARTAAPTASSTVTPAATLRAAAPAAGNPGTPNAQRGFLGFGG